jgi:hypothetical protein
MPTGQLIFGCSIDNHKSPEGEAEMRRKFQRSPQPMAPWDFREFFVFLPGGNADSKTATELRHLATALSQPRKPWWPFRKSHEP